MLNGELELKQNNSTIPRPYVSSALPVKHVISLKDSDAAYLRSNASSVLSYWFVDCVYYGVTDDLSFGLNYTGKAGEEKYVESFVVASHELPTPPPPPPTTSTTPSNVTEKTSVQPTTPVPPAASSSSTSAASSNNTAATSTASSATPATTTIPNPPTKATSGDNAHDTNSNSTDSHPKKIPDVYKNITLVQGKNYSNDQDFPYICSNSSAIMPPDGKESYGYFKRKLEIRGELYYNRIYLSIGCINLN